MNIYLIFKILDNKIKMQNPYFPPIDLPVLEKFEQVSDTLKSAVNALLPSLGDMAIKPLLWFFIVCTMKMEYFSLGVIPTRAALRGLQDWLNRLNRESSLFTVEPWIRQTLIDNCRTGYQYLIECVDFDFYTLLCERVYRALDEIDPNTLTAQQQQLVQLIMDLLEYKKFFIDFEIQTGRAFTLADFERQQRSEEESQRWAQQQIAENLQELEALQPSEPIYIGPLASERRRASELEARRHSQRMGRSRLYRESVRSRTRRRSPSGPTDRASHRRSRSRSRSASRTRRRSRSRSRRSGNTPAHPTQPTPATRPSSGGSRPSRSRGEEGGMCIMM